MTTFILILLACQTVDNFSKIIIIINCTDICKPKLFLFPTCNNEILTWQKLFIKKVIIMMKYSNLGQPKIIRSWWIAAIIFDNKMKKKKIHLQIVTKDYIFIQFMYILSLILMFATFQGLIYDIITLVIVD